MSGDFLYSLMTLSALNLDLLSLYISAVFFGIPNVVLK